MFKKDLNTKNDSICDPISPLAQRQYILEATSPTKVVVSSTSGANSQSDNSSMSMTMMKGGLSQSLKLQPKALTNISLNKVSLLCFIILTFKFINSITLIII